jgi:hypothetical protein
MMKVGHVSIISIRGLARLGEHDDLAQAVDHSEATATKKLMRRSFASRIMSRLLRETADYLEE